MESNHHLQNRSSQSTLAPFEDLQKYFCHHHVNQCDQGIPFETWEGVWMRRNGWERMLAINQAVFDWAYVLVVGQSAKGQTRKDGNFHLEP